MSPLPETDTADVTVVVTCYNHQSYVEQCLASILTQTSTPRRVIVVDDHSTDDSGDVIATWIARHDAPFTFVRHSVNFGLCRSLNETLDDVETEYLVHISGDDWMLPARLAQQSAALDSTKDAAFAASDFLEVDAGGLLLARHDVGARLSGLTGSRNRDQFMRKMLEGNIIPAPAVMMRTEVVRRVSGWDETLAFEDYDMWLKLGERHGVEYARGDATCYRMIRDSMSHSTQFRGSFLRSELACLSKLYGRQPEWDAVIDRRIAGIEEDLARATEQSMLPKARFLRLATCGGEVRRSRCLSARRRRSS